MQTTCNPDEQSSLNASSGVARANSKDSDDDDEEELSAEGELEDRQHQPIPEFLYQLTKLLTDDNSEIIEWLNGRIKVHYPERLEGEVLHKYFRHSKFASFQRQLNYFSFRKIAGKGKMSPCSYINEEATSDIRSLLLIKRKTNGSAARKAALQQFNAAATQSASFLPGMAGGINTLSNPQELANAMSLWSQNALLSGLPVGQLPQPSLVTLQQQQQAIASQQTQQLLSQQLQLAQSPGTASPLLNMLSLQQGQQPQHQLPATVTSQQAQPQLTQQIANAVPQLSLQSLQQQFLALQQQQSTSQNSATNQALTLRALQQLQHQFQQQLTPQQSAPTHALNLLALQQQQNQQQPTSQQSAPTQALNLLAFQQQQNQQQPAPEQSVSTEALNLLALRQQQNQQQAHQPQQPHHSSQRQGDINPTLSLLTLQQQAQQGAATQALNLLATQQQQTQHKQHTSQQDATAQLLNLLVQQQQQQQQQSQPQPQSSQQELDMVTQGLNFLTGQSQHLGQQKAPQQRPATQTPNQLASQQPTSHDPLTQALTLLSQRQQHHQNGSSGQAQNLLAPPPQQQVQGGVSRPLQQASLSQPRDGTTAQQLNLLALQQQHQLLQRQLLEQQTLQAQQSQLAMLNNTQVGHNVAASDAFATTTASLKTDSNGGASQSLEQLQAHLRTLGQQQAQQQQQQGNGNSDWASRLLEQAAAAVTSANSLGSQSNVMNGATAALNAEMPAPSDRNLATAALNAQMPATAAMDAAASSLANNNLFESALNLKSLLDEHKSQSDNQQQQQHNSATQSFWNRLPSGLFSDNNFGSSVSFGNLLGSSNRLSSLLSLNSFIGSREPSLADFAAAIPTNVRDQLIAADLAAVIPANVRDQLTAAVVAENPAVQDIAKFRSNNH